MKNHTRSILEELSKYVPRRNKHEILESRSEHVLASAINLMEFIAENYDAESVELLEKRFISAIKGKDEARFKRALQKVKGDAHED